VDCYTLLNGNTIVSGMKGISRVGIGNRDTESPVDLPFDSVFDYGRVVFGFFMIALR
jgi:hypothetical protein